MYHPMWCLSSPRGGPLRPSEPNQLAPDAECVRRTGLMRGWNLTMSSCVVRVGASVVLVRTFDMQSLSVHVQLSFVSINVECATFNISVPRW